MTSARPAIVFCMPLRGHFQRLRSIIAGLAEQGVPVHVFTDRAFAPAVERAGGRFVDLFAGRPLESVDATSMPMPCRFVSFAGYCADAVAREVAALRPGVIIHDTFAVIGWAVANELGVPRVNVCAAHNTAPAPTLARLQRDPRVAIAPVCHDAARRLREHYGIVDANPFSYVTGVSPDLNVYCEPPQFLPAEDRAAFEPLVFYGSLSTDELESRVTDPSPWPEGAGASRVYVSFGTVIWRYYETDARRALATIADAIASLSDTNALVSLGGWERMGLAPELARPNVRIEGYVDQVHVLREATAFITHHGLNSTHEAVANRVPMISYPFFGDQPAMTTRCRELGIAMPLATAPRAAFTANDVRAALARVAAERSTLTARLSEAREWELATIRERPQVIARIRELMARGSS